MKTLNKVMLIGRLGQDPEGLYTASGSQVSKFSLATSERFRDAKGDYVDRTVWHSIICWNKLAEICNKHLTKGSLVYIEGSLEYQNWTDTNHVKRYRTQIRAYQLNMLGGKSQQEESPGQTQDQVPF